MCFQVLLLLGLFLKHPHHIKKNQVDLENVFLLWLSFNVQTMQIKVI